MQTKEIWRRARKLVAAQLPDNLAYRDLEDQEDYGLDGEVELINAGEAPSGVVFKTQLKGTRQVTVRKGRVVYSGVSVDKAEYLVRFRLPVVLFVAGIATGTVYWMIPQLDDDLRESIEDARVSGRKFVSIGLPMENVLASTIERLLHAVGRARHRVTVRALGNRLREYQGGSSDGVV